MNSISNLNERTLMKKLLFVLIIAGASFLSIAQTQTTEQTHLPVMNLPVTSHDFGEIIETNGTVSCSFTISNTGNADLLITSVQGTCGCTVPQWTKEPISPSKDGSVSVTYNPKNRPGAFNKKITIFSNAATNPVSVFIKGTVVQNASVKIQENETVK